MNLTTDCRRGVAIVHVHEARLTYPLLTEFAGAVTSLIGGGERHLVLDLSAVTSVDSATIGCVMDLARQAGAVGGALKIAGVQTRVGTLLAMTGAARMIEIHVDESAAVRSFGGQVRPTPRLPRDGDSDSQVRRVSARG